MGFYSILVGGVPLDLLHVKNVPPFKTGSKTGNYNTRSAGGHDLQEGQSSAGLRPSLGTDEDTCQSTQSPRPEPESFHSKMRENYQRLVR